MLSHDTTERWLPVVGYEGVYEVSDLGRVRRASASLRTPAGFIRRLCLNIHGRYYLHLSRNGVKRPHSVHRLVAAAFIGPCPPGFHVNHIDGDKTNNLVGNLEYNSPPENYAHAVKHALTARGAGNAAAKLTENQILEIRALRGTAGARKIGPLYGVSKTVVQNIWNGKSWRHVA